MVMTKEEKKEYNKQYKKEHKEEIKETRKKYNEEHKEEIKETRKKYNEEHKEEIKETRKKYHEEHKEEEKEYRKNRKKEMKKCSKKYHEEHKEERNEYNRQYRKEHPEEIKEYHTKYREEHQEEQKEYSKEYKKTHTADIICLNCGQPVKVYKKNKFCSKSCVGKYRHGPLSSNWKGGISFEPYCQKFNRDLKRRIRAFFNNECVICGKTKIENKKELSCHHVTYNKMVCCDGKPVHFTALCGSCHAKTNHDRERWEAILHTIIDYLYDGKSYYTKDEWKNVP